MISDKLFLMFFSYSQLLQSFLLDIKTTFTYVYRGMNRLTFNKTVVVYKFVQQLDLSLKRVNSAHHKLALHKELMTILV